MKTTRKITRRPRRRLNRKRGFRKARDVPELASLSCKRSLETGSPPGPGFNSNTLYSLMNTQLIDYDRAAIVASQYQHYRIKKITVTWKPTFDNYLAAGGAVTKPNLYYMIDKSGSLPANITLEGLKQCGAKPRQLDEKNMSVSWRPSVLESVMYAPGAIAATQASKYSISPWLTTNNSPAQGGAFVPSGIDHLGIYWYMDQLQNPVGAQYTVEVEVQFQFKKPLNAFEAGAPEAIPAKIATKNNSPDGVVGGGDGV